VLFEKLRRVADGQNRLCGVVGNFATELFFKCHYKLDGVETVRAEVVDETCSVNHLVWFDTEVLDHNLLNPLANLTHRSTSCLFHWTRPQTTPPNDASHRGREFPSLSHSLDSARS